MIKKFISYLLITVLFFTNSIPAFADETAWLLKIKNSDTNSVKNIVEFYARQTNMPEVLGNEDYTYVMVSSQKNDYWLATYEKISDEVSFFLYSPSDKSNVKKDLKVRFKKNNIKYSTERSTSMLKLKNQDAQKIIKDIQNEYNQQLGLNDNQQTIKDEKTTLGQDNTISVINNGYDFSDEAQARYNTGLQPKNNLGIINSTNNQNNYHVENVTKDVQKQNIETVRKDLNTTKQTYQLTENSLPSGITLLVSLQSAVSTSSLASQDRLSATLKSDVRIGNSIIPAGSLVYGTATQAEKASGAYKDGSVTIKFDRLLTLEGQEYSFNSKPIILKNTNSGISSRGAKIAGRMVAATLAGVALAALTGAIIDTDNWGRNIAIGASSGAVSGGISLIGANGEEVDIKEGATLTVITE